MNDGTARTQQGGMLSRRGMLAGSLWSLGGAVVAPGLVNAVADERDRSIERPNILLILVDDLGNRSLSCFGGSVPTPHLDSLAAAGVVFSNAHACPMCAPTRDEMFTGVSRARIKGRPGAEYPFFTNHLRKQGYATGMAGKWFVGSVFNPPLRGFDESCIMVNGYRFWAPDIMLFGSHGMFREFNQPAIDGRLNEWEIPFEGDLPNKPTRLRGKYAEDVSVDFLCDFIERRAPDAKAGKRPFFAYYSSKLTHVPQSPTPDSPRVEQEIFEEAIGTCYDRTLRTLYTDVAKAAKERGTQLTGNYREAGIAYLDKMVGRLVETLKDAGVVENTLILFLSDNGNSAIDPLREGVEALPGKKGDCREGGTRIPMIAHWPAVILKQRSYDGLVHVQDFSPTLQSLAERPTGQTRPTPPPSDGLSFAHVLLDEPGPEREYFIGWGAHPSVWFERVRAELGEPDRPGDRLVWVHGKRYKLYNDGRFYDLQADLAEEHRILPGGGTPEAEDVRKRFAQILKELGA